MNALSITAIFSANNTYMYGASRILYGLSLEGRAPTVLYLALNNPLRGQVANPKPLVIITNPGNAEGYKE
jgi:amino acid transporter